MTSTDHPLGEGDLLETVMVGPPVRGRFATWHEDGRRLWALADPAGLSKLIGTGQLARTLREPRRYREVVLVGEAIVLGMERTAPSDDGTVTMGSVVLASRRVEPEPEDADEAAWRAFAGWLTGIVLVPPSVVSSSCSKPVARSSPTSRSCWRSRPRPTTAG